MNPTVSVIIPHYFPERRDNLPRIVDAVREQATEILIWNNEPAPLHVPGALVIQSPRNMGCQARFLAALMARGDWIVFQDNDLVLRPDTLSILLAAAATEPSSLITLDGRQAVDGQPYRHWTKVRGGDVTRPTPVTLSLGRCEIAARWVVRSLLQSFPFDPTTVMDDLWFSWCAKQEGIPIVVWPCAAMPTKLASGGVGLSRTEDYYADRQHTVEFLELDVQP